MHNDKMSDQTNLEIAFGQRVRAVRKASRLSIRELSGRAGVDKNTLVRIEKGCPVRVSTLHRVCAALGVIPPVGNETFHAPVGNGYSVSDAQLEQWIRLNVDDPNEPSLVASSTGIQSQEVRHRLGTSGLANQFMRRLLCQLPNGKLKAAIFEVYGDSGWASQPSGEAFVYGIKGRILFRVEEEEFVLEEGEAAIFDRTKRHMHKPVGPITEKLVPTFLYIQTE
jgi:transcriptional regulator with XRE-family HTH domain